MDVLNDAGSVRTAWESMIYSTKTTANAHSDLAVSLQSELVAPLEGFLASNEALLKSLTAEGKELHKQLVEADDAVSQAQRDYYRTCLASDPDSAGKLRASISTVNGAVQTPDAMHKEYEEAARRSNAAQEHILKSGLRLILSRLEQLESRRIKLTKVRPTCPASAAEPAQVGSWPQVAMNHFVDLTAQRLPEKLGQPVVEEVVPCIAAINGESDLSTFCTKHSSGRKPGSIATRAYDPVRDIPPSQKSLAQLSASGGGPIKCGWTYKEGHLVRNWRKRWFVLWPLNFKDEAVSGPALYYFDDSESDSCPKGTLPIFGSNVGMPKKARKGYEWLIRIEGAKAGDGEEEAKHDKLVFAVDTQQERDVRSAAQQPALLTSDVLSFLQEWLEVLGNASRGETVQRLITFGAALGDLNEKQCARLPDCQAGVPMFFLDVLCQLEKMQCFTTEGIFRVPGDNDDVQELKGRYELDEYTSRDFADGAEPKEGLSSSYDIHVWGSFLKAWIRSIKEPLVIDSCYESAINIVTRTPHVPMRIGCWRVFSGLLLQSRTRLWPSQLSCWRCWQSCRRRTLR